MLIGASFNWYAVTDMFTGSSLATWFTNNLNYIPLFVELGVSPFYRGMPASAKFASVGFMVFGCGVEMAGITVSRGIVKWFKGREMAMAMGSEMALARLGVATCMIFSPLIAKANIFGGANVSHAVAFGVILLMIALIMFIVYFFMDKKLDSQTGEAEEKDDPFKIKDIGKILSSTGFWLVALLCVLYYSAIFPFQKYAVNMLECNLTFVEPKGFWAGNTVTIVQYLIMLLVAILAFVSNFSKGFKKITFIILSVLFLVVFCIMGYMRQSAETIFAVFPLLAVGVTPILGKYVDSKGKAASMLMIGSILLIVCHLTFAFILPLFQGNNIGGVIIAYITILILGASFSLVPASLWPSVPKLVDNKVIGSAYALIFWIQNIGLWLFPLLIGKILDASNPEIVQALKDGTMTSKQAAISYDYTNPLIMLACLGVAALILGFILKYVDKKKGLGLELPNIKE
jgi:MFS family permease